jgi:alkylated DNA repair protein alkB family protein 7
MAAPLVRAGHVIRRLPPRRPGSALPLSTVRSTQPSADMTPNYVCFAAAPGWSLARCPLLVVPHFVTSAEHDALAAEAQASLRRRQYEKGHWDGVIRGFREAQKPLGAWPAGCRAVFERVHARFPSPSTQAPMPSVHVLDLAADGVIQRHVDSVKFSGDIVAGISLLSDGVMRLRHETSDAVIALHLPARSLYMLCGEARYHWGHEVPAGTVDFKGTPVTRGRRVSLIIRDELATGMGGGAGPGAGAPGGDASGGGASGYGSGAGRGREGEGAARLSGAYGKLDADGNAHSGSTR